jgi:hypothetical protein
MIRDVIDKENFKGKVLLYAAFHSLPSSFDVR